MLYNEQHVLHPLLPERHCTVYSLRTRRRDRTLSAHTGSGNFIYADFFLKISFKLILISRLLPLCMIGYKTISHSELYLLRFVSGKLNEYVISK